MRKTIEEKKRIGVRMINCDGFSYSYGKGKFNKGKGYMAYVRRSKRADKRGWKFKHKMRVWRETTYGGKLK